MNPFEVIAQDPLDDETCAKLDVFVRILYFFTGACQAPAWLLTVREKLSQYSIYVSVTSWLCAQMPQILKNYREKDVMGLSPKFLIAWFLSDYMNFISNVCNPKLAFQAGLSMYYCVVDLILGMQYYYYMYMYEGPSNGLTKRLEKRQNMTQVGTANPMTSRVAEFTERFAAKRGHEAGSYVPVPTVVVSQPEAGTATATPAAPPAVTGTSGTAQAAATVTAAGAVGAAAQNVSGAMAQAEAIADDTTGDTLLSAVTGALGTVGSAAKNGKGLVKVLGTGLAMLGKAKALPISLAVQVLDPSTSVAKKRSLISSFFHYFMTLNKEKVGQLISWAAAASYIYSRIPQLFKNVEIQSTKGLSYKLIMCTLLGNLFFVIGILASEEAFIGGKKCAEFWEDQLPYVIGSFCSVLLDGCVLAQRAFYDLVDYAEDGIDEIGDQIEDIGAVVGDAVGGDLGKTIKHVTDRIEDMLDNDDNSSHLSISDEEREAVEEAAAATGTSGTADAAAAKPIAQPAASQPTEQTPLTPSSLLLGGYQATGTTATEATPVAPVEAVPVVAAPVAVPAPSVAPVAVAAAPDAVAPAPVAVVPVAVTPALAPAPVETVPAVPVVPTAPVTPVTPAAPTEAASAPVATLPTAESVTPAPVTILAAAPATVPVAVPVEVTPVTAPVAVPVEIAPIASQVAVPVTAVSAEAVPVAAVPTTAVAAPAETVQVAASIAAPVEVVSVASATPAAAPVEVVPIVPATAVPIESVPALASITTIPAATTAAPEPAVSSEIATLTPPVHDPGVPAAPAQGDSQTN